MMKLSIKNMVCNRCIMTVAQVFQNVGITPVKVELGQVELQNVPSQEQFDNAGKALEAFGFEILSDDKHRTIEKMKNLIIDTVHRGNLDEAGNFSTILSEAIHRDYSALSKLFSELEGITIEKYIIQQKIEKVKELLSYGEMNLNEIAFQMGYSSSAHLSAQFKSLTGFSPSAFRKSKDHHRRPLDSI